MVALGLLCALSHCEIARKLTRRNNPNEANPETPLRLPNGPITPLPNQDVPGATPDPDPVATVDADAPSLDDAGESDAGGVVIAVVDAGIATERIPGGGHHSDGPAYRTYCKTHPGMINPYTGVLCPAVIPGVIVR
jgi:hypothetical protein